MTYKEIETKNGLKYYFWDEENTLIASVREDGTIINHTRDLTEEEEKEIKEIIS